MRHILTIILLVLAQAGVLAQTEKKATAAEAEMMIAAVNRTAEGIHTLQGRFTQVKTMSFLNDKMTSTGMLYLTDKGQLRWEFTSPYSYIFIINDNQVTIRSGKKTQNIDMKSSRLFEGIARIMVNSMTGRCLQKNGDFDVEMYTRGTEWIAWLTPKKAQMKKMFKLVKLHFSSTQNMVTSVEMTEPSGDNTVIELKDITLNQPVDEAVFTLH
ncbi:MAG: outer membrane lipoprotein carrier protein LolA [Prevotella sp.]|nr:outer membrane lipoprotein carrier protein LolA [Prevotella sp.]